jgi:preprotein translocase subunit SecD
MLIAMTLASMIPVRAKDRAQPTELTGLVVAKVEETTVQGQNGIEITFDKASAERLRQFTNGKVGRSLEFVVDQKRLVTLRLIDPLTDGNILLTGQMDNAALISSGATVTVKLE